MIKKLKKKFITLSMTMVTIVLVLLLFAINIINAITIVQETNYFIDEDILGFYQEDDETLDVLEFPFLIDRNDYLFFVCQKNADNSFAIVKKNEHVTLTEEQMINMVSSIYNRNKEEGFFNSYYYRKINNYSQSLCVFVDETQEIYSIRRIFFISFGIGVLGWGIIFWIVVYWSRKVIEPIENNMNKQKQFVTDAGHEIKTPLAIIMANTEALELYNGNSKYTDNIKKQTYRLNELMQNLLSLAKDNEEDTIRNELNISNIISMEINMFAELFESKRQTVTKNIENNVVLLANKEQMNRLFSILIDNAIKYGENDSVINITLHKKNKNIEFSISNYVEKLPDCHPRKLFDRFYRDDSSRNQKTGGNGIGLSSAKTIVESYGGKIRAHYINNNQIQFIVTL